MWLVETKFLSEGWSGRRMWFLESKVRPKDNPSEGCDWLIRRFVRRMIRPKGCDWSRWKSVRRIIRPKDVIGQYEDLVLWFVRRMLWRLLIGWDEATCPYDEASDLSSCQTNLIGREGNLVFSSLARLIGLSDGLVLIRTLLSGQFADQLPASSLGFLVARIQTCKRADEKMITRSVFFGQRIRCSDLFLTPKQTKRTSPCVTYSTRGGVYIRYTMLVDGAREVCVF